MKSVVQEASTIGKAIEQGWKAAGEPRDFSIKILEIPQHNFLGFTTRSAKVAIVFDENAPRESAPRTREPREREPRQRGDREPREGRERTSRERTPRTREPRREGGRERDGRDRDVRDRDGRDRDGIDRDNRERDSRDRDNRGRDGRSRDRDSRDRDGRDRDGRDRDGRDRFGREESSREERNTARTDSRGRERRDRFREREQRESGRDAYRSTRPAIPESPVDEQVDFIDDIVLRGGVPPVGVQGSTAPVSKPKNEPVRELPQPDIETEFSGEDAGSQEVDGDQEGAKQLGQWDAELVASANRWLTETLRLMDLSDVTFTLEPQNFHLRITLSKPLISDDAKEKHLFASLATLMMASLKKEFRKALRGHKIVIVHG